MKSDQKLRLCVLVLFLSVLSNQVCQIWPPEPEFDTCAVYNMFKATKKLVTK